MNQIENFPINFSIGVLVHPLSFFVSFWIFTRSIIIWFKIYKFAFCSFFPSCSTAFRFWRLSHWSLLIFGSFFLFLFQLRLHLHVWVCQWFQDLHPVHHRMYLWIYQLLVSAFSILHSQVQVSLTLFLAHLHSMPKPINHWKTFRLLGFRSS